MKPPLPPAARMPFFLTTSWDDGSIQDLRLAEMLAKYQWPATFYIAQSSEFRGLSDAQIRDLGSSFEIGAHTLNHVTVSSVSDQVAATEIAGSKVWVEQLLGRACNVFCFPRGRFHRRHLTMVKAAGFRGARTAELMWLSNPREEAGLAVLPTTVQAFPHSFGEYTKNLVRRGAIRNLATYALYGRGRNWVSAAGSLLRRVAATGGVFHLWGHSWELEQFSLWADLENLFRESSEYASIAERCTNSQLC